MIARLQTLALTALAVLLVVFGAYGAGGRAAKLAATRDRNLDEARRAAAGAKGVHDAQVHIDGLPDGGAGAELRNDWVRD